jgi:hypothetical protein
VAATPARLGLDKVWLGTKKMSFKQTKLEGRNFLFYFYLKQQRGALAQW